MPFDSKLAETGVERAVEAPAPPGPDNVELLARDLERTRTFDLMRHAHACGTPACIAGHAVARWPHLQNPHAERRIPRYRCFAEHVGLDKGAVERLCLPAWVNDGRHSTGFLSPGPGRTHVCPYAVTGRMAAAALRRLRDTGEAYFDPEDA